MSGRRFWALPLAVLTIGLVATPAVAVQPLERPPRGPVGLAPGISYQLQQRASGPVHIVRMRPGPRRTLGPVLTSGRPSARAPLTAAVRARSARGAVAAINGDFFNVSTAHPSGLLLIDGLLIRDPEPSRTALLLPPGGGLLAERLALQGSWQADESSTAFAIDAINRPALRGRETLLYTPIYGASTPVGSGLYEASIRLDGGGGLAANVARGGTVLARASGGGLALRAGEVVLTAVGADGPRLAEALPVGTRVTITPTVAGLPNDVLQGIGGGPLLVRDGRAVPDAGEGFSDAQLSQRTARSAVGQQRNGTLLLVMAEGPQTGRRGLTVAEQADLMADLGAGLAVAMDAGGSAALALGSRLAAPARSERSITDALLASYSGVHLSLLSSGRMTPNGDGVADSLTGSARVPTRGVLTLTLAHRSGREIRLTRRRTGPTARRITLDARRLRLSDGVYTLRSRLEPEGGGSPTSHSRRVIVDSTLGHLRLRPHARRTARRIQPRLDIGFRLSRDARVTIVIRRADGRRVTTLLSGRRMSAGPHLITWDRTLRGRPVDGDLLVDVESLSRLGRSGLRAAITLRDPRRR